LVPSLIQRRFFEEISLREKDIVYYLQRTGNSSTLSTRKALTSDLKLQIDRMEPIAIKLFKPKGIFKIFCASELPARECFAEADKIALAIVTIGISLPQEVNNLMNSGEYVDGVILDAFGSAGVEEVADQIDREIKEIARDQKLQYSQRYSPGYCQWGVQDQQIIFNHLPGQEIGVSLSEGFMMNPIKSVSFAINIGKNIKKSKWEMRCKTCEDRGQCTYRMQ
jgi:cobalamin-dependent methionine synthase I